MSTHGVSSLKKRVDGDWNKYSVVDWYQRSIVPLKLSEIQTLNDIRGLPDGSNLMDLLRNYSRRNGNTKL